jgi:hypothetical protein
VRTNLALADRGEQHTKRAEFSSRFVRFLDPGDGLFAGGFELALCDVFGA